MPKIAVNPNKQVRVFEKTQAAVSKHIKGTYYNLKTFYDEAALALIKTQKEQKQAELNKK